MISSDYAFRIGHRISPNVQQAIIHEVLTHGQTANVQPFWVKCDVRSMDRPRGGSENPPEDFFYRLDPRTAWHWEDTPLANMVRPMVDSVEHLFTKLTRVKVFIQKPHMAISAHRDLVPGNEYKHISGVYTPTIIGTYCGIYHGHPNLPVEPNTRHRDQKYLNLKIPLTSVEGNYGKPYIIGKSEGKEYLSADGHFYFLNEYEIFHGCDVVDFPRGIIFVDGILDMESLKNEPKLEFQ